MIVFVNPRATRPANRRFPLSIMALGASVSSGESWSLVDGNLPDADPFAEVAAHVDGHRGGSDPVRLIAMTVMPGPQLVNAVPLARRLKSRYPNVPIVWGGYFPSLYPEPVLRASYVDWIVSGQGERPLGQLLEVLAGRKDPQTVAGLGYRTSDRSIVVNPPERWVGPNELPAPPYDRIDVASYLRPTVLGSRSGVYQASIGCPYSCNFCGVISVFGSRERVESPERTATHLGRLAQRHGMNAVHFYDNNFFVREDHAAELCERIEPLGLSWWCEARIDAMLRFSDATWRKLRRAGLKMVFFGAESGSNAVLRKMSKRLTIEQTLEIAARTKAWGIVPEFSFVLGDPDDPVGELDNTLRFIRHLKRINPAMELITYFYTPTPQRRGTYGDVDARAGTPATLEEWIEPRWVAWMTHENPDVPWLTETLRARVENFELVLKSRFPSRHDRRTRAWGKALGRVLAARRWRRGEFDDPRMLRALRRLAGSGPTDRQAYGHLRVAPGVTA